MSQKIFRLKGQIQNYAWGGKSYISHLLHVNNAENEPMAEYWMGAHPKAPSTIKEGEKNVLLNSAIQSDPVFFVGEKTWDRFGELPYLFKVLDVNEMLSIQVHPTKAEAEKGFDAEEKAGIPIGAPYRNYKDRNHKPEVSVALTDCWLLHGFLPKNELENRIYHIAAFQSGIAAYENGGNKALYQYLMELPQSTVNEILQPLILQDLETQSKGKLDRTQPGWWVSKLYPNGWQNGDIDKGVFSIYLFNIVHVQPGNAIFQEAGIPHAYLEGQMVELMANSDNVLRGGLTPKHVDVPELLKHTNFEGIVPKVMIGEQLNPFQKIYPCPVPDFGIESIELHAENVVEQESHSLEIILMIHGSLQINSEDGSLSLAQGDAVAIVPNTQYELKGVSQVLAYKAFVPGQ